MGELLRGGGQILCDDPARLADAVRRAIDGRDALAASGRRFAREFSAERFAREWRTLVDRLSVDAAEGIAAASGASN
jgi:hypothetical protein